MSRHALSFAIAFFTLNAAAQDRTAAQALFDEGLRAMDAGDTSRACAKFAASQSMEPAVGTALNLGRCEEARGKLASAWIAFSDAAAMASRDGDEKRLALARGREAALWPHVPKLVVVLRGRVDGEITKDGVRIEAGALEAPLPVDPGIHIVEVRSAGRVIFHTEVTCSADEEERVEIENTIVEEPTPHAANADVQPKSSTSTPSIVPSIVTMAAGIAAFGVAIPLWVTASGKYDALARTCGMTQTCTDAQVADPKTLAIAGDIAAIVGSTALVVGVVLFGVRAAHKAPHMSVALSPLPGGAYTATTFAF